MFRLALIVPMAVGAVAHADLIEYTMSGNGVILYEANDSNSTMNSIGRSWNAGAVSAVHSTYAYRFYADTDNVVSDGNGGYYMPIEAFHFEFGDGSLGAVDEDLVFHVAANGAASFRPVEPLVTEYMISWEDFSLVSEGFLAGYDPTMELETVQTILDIQNYNSGSFIPIFEAEHGAAGFAVESISFGARYVDSIPPVPAPGALCVIGAGGMLAARRRR